MPKGTIQNRLLPAITFIILIILWELVTKVADLPVWLLPAPSDIVKSLVGRNDMFMHTWVTFYETILGFLLAILIGVPLAVLVNSSPLISNTIYPLILITQSIPKVAFAPILLIWVGYGIVPKIIIAFLVAFFPVVIDTATGLNSPSPELINLARQLNASKIQIYTKIRFPSALPHFFSGLKVAITLSVIGAVIGEFVGSDVGLGYIVIMATSQFKTPLSFAAMLLLALMGIVLFFVIALIEKLSIPWYGRGE
ncbi:MAG: ABC transporter permease [Chloroflexi bacterium GWB2_49_20]|nr:MAG: ABC transporter permease [Chloroflexi bacterium GWB2_49_20]OGN79646.1 MAG: ABC transporter permease [Chloroflexi bacterium GWC2_49_37]OGN83042.1 MAG: ABC transporter permease [Chloroflexi bacterium GWD2_49_16]